MFRFLWRLWLVWAVVFLLVIEGCYGPGTGGDPRQVTPDLIGLLTDPHPDVRRTAAIALGRLGSYGAVDALLPVLRDPDPGVRQWAAWALGVVGEDRSREVGFALVDVLRDSSPAVRMAAAQALGELEDDPRVTDRVVEQLQAEEPGIQSAAALAMVGRGRVDDLPKLRQALRRVGPSARQSLVAALGEMDDKRVVPLLQGRLREDGDAGVRGEAAYRLGMLADEAARPALEHASRHDSDDQVRRWAEWAVSAMEPADARGSGPPPI